jgi:hypothetical protein
MFDFAFREKTEIKSKTNANRTGRYYLGYFVGRASPIAELCVHLGKQWVKGLGAARQLFAQR